MNSDSHLLSVQETGLGFRMSWKMGKMRFDDGVGKVLIPDSYKVYICESGFGKRFLFSVEQDSR